jgi:hypothetical protein
MRGTRLSRGNRSITVPAPLQELPLMVRAGAILPLLPAQTDTLAQYGIGIKGLDSLPDVRRRLHLLAFPRGRSTASLHGRERLISTESTAGWTLRFRGGHTTRTYDLEASMATLKRPFVPCAVQLGDEPLERNRWSFNRKRGVLLARFRTLRETLRVRPCL